MRAESKKSDEDPRIAALRFEHEQALDSLTDAQATAVTRMVIAHHLLAKHSDEERRAAYAPMMEVLFELEVDGTLQGIYPGFGFPMGAA
ncbi:hypothetical protein [Phenylobacterium soli]|uniref:Uncharacterized protein n=1 Tax=Phenylobacterium soli TaxID=2170551 RepID=A0A328AAH0_9CAUL|nr:hypothetical protein [Phenylobacterium soli]RAK51601.1 hypothetical protein DJ017_17345 [Phenylobacterium soli]